jgi:hypothetical protein
LHDVPVGRIKLRELVDALFAVELRLYVLTELPVIENP